MTPIFAPAERIISAVALQYGFCAEDLKGDDRHALVTMARHEAMYRCYWETELGRVLLGKVFRKDPTTILYGIRKHQERMNAQARAA